MTSRISGIVPLLLITVVCIGLVEGGYLLLEHFILDSPDRAEVSEVDTTTERSETKTAGGKKTDYRIILKRNLFGPPPGSDKTATDPVEKPEEVLTASSLQIVLMGTITGSEGVERAIILDKNSQKQELYEKGDAIQGASIKDISRGKVILSYAGRDEILDISEAAKVRPPVRRTTPIAAAGQSQTRTPMRQVPRPSATIAPEAPPDEMAPPSADQMPQPSAEEISPPSAEEVAPPSADQMPSQSADVTPAPARSDSKRGKNMIMPQRIYRPTQPYRKQ